MAKNIRRGSQKKNVLRLFMHLVMPKVAMVKPEKRISATGYRIRIYRKDNI